MLKLRGKRPGNLGAKDGRLAPCPRTPNCVSSQAESTDPVHHLAPLKVTGEPEGAMSRLARVVRAHPRTEIIEQNERYLYAEFSTNWLGFVDDVEFYLAPEEKRIHVRSASRLGYSDLGVNRRRVEQIRAEFEKGG